MNMNFKIENYSTIFVVGFETGAANILSSFLKNCVINNKDCYKAIKYCLAGPAKQIFETKLKDIDAAALQDINKLDSEVDIVFTGRSLIPELERGAIRLAKSNKVKVVTFLDHWVNYEGGFLPVSKKNDYSGEDFLYYLPDEIVVGDAYADQIIKKTKIPYDRVRFVENEYFNDMKSFFKSNQAAANKRVLYLSEPIYDDLKQIYNDGNILGFNEFDVVKDLVNAASVFKQIGFDELAIRLHPNEAREKYEDIIRKSAKENLNIGISKNQKLEEDITKSSLVVGMESMGLVIAILAGKKVVSYLPKSAVKKCSLPHKELIHINDFSLLKGLKI